MRDDCDPATFNAALRPGACVGNGDVTFQEFEAELNPRDFGEDHWRFNPDHTEIRHNEALRPFNRAARPIRSPGWPRTVPAACRP